MGRRYLRSTTFIFFVLLTACQLSFAQSPKIGKIQFEGLQRLSLDEMIQTTALKVGDPFNIAAVDAAAQRLIDSGLFKTVGYRTRTNAGQVTITFEVEETKGPSSRVIFDNFIWFSDSELLAAVKRDIPTFSGAAPDSGDTVDRIRHALRRFLHEHNIDADVTYMPSQDSPSSPVQEHVFSVAGVELPICTIHFPGSQNVSEAKLLEAAKPLMSADYSNKFVSLFAANTLIPLYREVGQLKAAFAPPLAKPESSATCKSGVELTLGVDEGAIYNWDKAEWTGVTAIPTTELDTLLGMKQGKPVNGVKLDKAVVAIRKALGRKGYILASLRSRPDFDDAAKTVVYRMDVREGPQFHMGQLIVKGFSESIAKQIQERWALKPGAVYDADYWLEFTQKSMNEILRQQRTQGGPVNKIKWDPAIHRDTLTVDLTVEQTN